MATNILAKKEKSEVKTSIIGYFEIFCNHKFGNESWQNFIAISEFSELIKHNEKYSYLFGDTGFGPIVDMVSEIKSIPVINLISEFSEFMNKYY